MAATSAASGMGAVKRRHSQSGISMWQLPLLLLPLLLLLAAAATAAPTADRHRCAHKGIAELIRTSPVIVKALAARIFTDAELAEQPPGKAAPSSGSAILITLTPETIYKGASQLKMASGSGAGASDGIVGSDASSGGPHHGGFGGGSGTSGWSGASYQYEGHLNATLEPLECFDANMLKMLPTELIAFGKLLPASAVSGTGLSGSSGSGGRPMQQPELGAALELASDKDILHISINGLHRWTPQFENHIWKHLGWDDWSDFTLCSVTCGKGVQQRFRRCLLDNPLVDINMNMNLSLDDDDDDDDDDDEVDEEQGELNVASGGVVADEANNDVADVESAVATEVAFNADNNEVLSQDTDGTEEALLMVMQPAAAAAAAAPAIGPAMSTVMHKSAPTTAAAGAAAAAATGLTTGGNEATGTGVSFVAVARNDRRRTRANNQHKKRKSTKSLALSTLLCEGYNIEQRNCNSFECSDDISDLLKFYKKLPMPTADESSTVPSNDSLPAESADLSTPLSVGVFSSSTPSNMGYIRGWRNMLNFTLMITLRSKNDTKNASTIFSIRNSTHNLYLDACKDGLRLYLERDNTTEMLPVKFNLYDYRWHQVAISIQNGDFISIYVDCLWTNSFVVSKRLFTLPLDADVEIGRGFNGELQQLLVLPEHQERLQCSNKRTSINEVKRYIIDTFIEDYASN